MKKSFILHIDTLNVLDELTDEQAGKLFKAIYLYQKNEKIELDFGLKMAFLPFKNQFLRDNTKYELVSERNRKNGVKGGRPKNKAVTKTQKNPKNPVGFSKTQKNPKNLESDSDSDSDKGKKKYIYIYNKFYDAQIKENQNEHLIEQYKIFVNFLFENETGEKLNGVLSIKNQLTFNQFKKIHQLKMENKKSIAEILLKMENDPKYTKGKKSLNLTLQNWIKNTFAQ